MQPSNAGQKATKVTVTDYQESYLVSECEDDPEIAALLPKNYRAQHCEFIINNVSNSIANGLRRTLSNELYTLAMIADFPAIKTTDLFHIQEMLIKRLRLIPLDQDCPIDAQFELDVSNTSADLIDITSAQITRLNPSGGRAANPKKLPFNETFTICTLGSARALKISPITVVRRQGDERGDGMHVIACNTASAAVDVKPIDLFNPENGGVSSSMANPRVYRIKFNTNGTWPPKRIVTAACDNIIARCKAVMGHIHNIKNEGDQYELSMMETDTIGNTMMQMINKLYPNIKYVTYSSDENVKSIWIRIRCDEDINEVYTSAVDALVNVYEQIKTYFI